MMKRTPGILLYWLTTVVRESLSRTRVGAKSAAELAKKMARYTRREAVSTFSSAATTSSAIQHSSAADCVLKGKDATCIERELSLDNLDHGCADFVALGI